MRYILSMMEGTDKDAIAIARGVDILRAMQWAKIAWSLVISATIINCFRKAGFMASGSREDHLESPVSDIDSTLMLAPEDIAIDDDLECYGELTDVDICAAVSSSNCQSESVSDDESTEEDTAESQLQQVSKKEAVQALSTLRSYLQQNCTEYNDSFFTIEMKIQESILHPQVQTTITDCFTRQ